MRIPAFVKTIRFRLTLMYTVLLLCLGVLVVGGINVAMEQGKPDFYDKARRYKESELSRRDMSEQEFKELMEKERATTLDELRRNSWISLGALLILGAAGGYFLSGRMLKPVDRVTATASRISHTSLKERIRHEGPDDELKRLSDTFDEMLERLEGSFEAQKQFLQDASHELRTPIAIAQTNLEVLEMQEDRSPGDYEHLTQVLKMSLERMTSVNDNLLLLSEGEQTQYRWSVVNMVTLVKEAAAEASARALVLEAALEVEATSKDIPVKGDPLRLKQAVMNLVDNAIKYNQPGGTVRISVTTDETVVNFSVRDTGIGISESDMPHLFDRFYRVDKSRSRSMGGSGLGLSIVKKIVEDHGGTVSAESILGEGSTFRIALPLYCND